MSSPGPIVCLAVLAALEPCSENTTSRPSVMLVMYAPSR
jgi:hypothetical protein